MCTFLFLILLASCDSEDVKVVARAGENATLPCLVPKHLQGTPVENLIVTWSTLEQSQLCSSRNATSECKEDVKDRVKMVNLDLVIANVSFSDQKLYSCTVKRGDHKVVNDVKLLVDYRITLEPDQTNNTAANTSSTTTSDSYSNKSYIIGGVVGGGGVVVVGVAVAVAVAVAVKTRRLKKTVEDNSDPTANGHLLTERDGPLENNLHTEETPL
ncbi:uncharacterized protein LOC131709070 [Acipenser ruthenus]|uniref:uncharacterized protein LOC131709070 n=1 Tax=Acipenser ruthenus TaxID=7906 RepID=UPI00274217AC|nr:uncharacterized protein LOC131709070 [Acipenser ruthenus]